MKLTIFGATGKTGLHLGQQALDAGHEVTAYVRTPSKLTLQHSRLMIVQGDILDAAQVDCAVKGANAILSVLGPSSNRPEFIVSRGMQHILNAMQTHHVRRLVISAGAGVPDPADRPGLLHHAISLILHLAAHNVAEDMTRVVKTVRESDRDWTIVRVPRLTDEPARGTLRIGSVGKGTGTALTRRDMATFMLNQVDGTQYLYQAPVISN